MQIVRELAREMGVVDGQPHVAFPLEFILQVSQSAAVEDDWILEGQRTLRTAPSSHAPSTRPTLRALIALLPSCLSMCAPLHLPLT